jgi:hypothetical protein
LFSRFKTFADHEANVPMDELLQPMSRAARVYRRVTERPTTLLARLIVLARIKAMESDVMKSVLLALLDDEHPPVPPMVVKSTRCH